MTRKQITRRDFVSGGTLAAGALVSGLSKATATEPDRSKILNYNENMEYRRLGKTGLMVSAVCLGGHWKRVGVMMKGPFKGQGYSKADIDNLNNRDFTKNRHEVVSRCIDVGINYIDACAGPEILAYSHALRGRRHKMYLGYSWHVRESRFPEWRSGKKLIEGFDEGLREAKLDYADLWRISLPMEQMRTLDDVLRVEEGAAEALAKAKKQGKARFTGVSTHNRVWLKSVIGQYPQQMEAVLFPYTASSKVLPEHSLFDAVTKHDVGVFGIKPFADNSLFVGDSSPNSPYREQDDRRARLAIRYILNNPAITAPIPGLISIHQVDNAAKAVQERRRLDLKEAAELEMASKEMWAHLSDGYQWLKDWEYV
jgi:aryl-alcohol dehydrogenase-like predicted oxidoreductase